jgi:hypothetical protein
MKAFICSLGLPSSRKYLFLFLLLFPGFIVARTGELKYPVSEISPELMKNADMVVRLDQTSLDITSLTVMTETVHVVYTVLRESAREKAVLRVFYDNDTKVMNLGGRMYDASGREIMRFRSSEIMDLSAVPSGTIYSDDRVKIIQPVSSDYPFTVEYEFERSYRQLMQYPQWCVPEDFNTSVESASLTVRAAGGAVPRYLTVNYPSPESWPERTSEGSLLWQLRNVPAVVEEPMCGGIRQVAPSVYISPLKVTIPGQDPEPASWKSYGSWINWLNRYRGILPPQVIEKIRQLTSGTSDSLSKLKIIYRYFQENTRYISVQIGIGGYQPENALSVAKNGYGDCKALANYMKALLECAGFRSLYTLVRAGKHERPVITDFPGLQFNHAILCVPMAKDTVWLECTSQSIPFGFLGSFTDNREVLLVTPGGGVLARTPAYPQTLNRLSRSAVIDLDSSGNARITSRTKVTGLQYELFEERLHQTAEEQKKSMREEIAIPTVNIVQLTYTKDEGTVPGITEILEINIPAFATLTGNRIFIPINPFNRISMLPPLENERKLPFYPGIGYTDIDSIVVRLPVFFTVENIPEAVNVSTLFGNYHSKAAIRNNELLYVRNVNREDIEFPPADYPAYHAFIRQISKADKTKVVLKKYLRLYLHFRYNPIGVFCNDQLFIGRDGHHFYP